MIAQVIAPGNDRKRPFRRRLAEQRLCRVLDGVVAPRADGDRGLRSACCGRHQHVAHAVLVDEEHAVFRARAAIVVELSSWLKHVRARRQLLPDRVVLNGADPGALDIDPVVVARVGMQPGLCACRQDQEHPVPALAWLRAFTPELNRLQRDLRCQRSPVELTCRQVDSGCRLFLR